MGRILKALQQIEAKHLQPRQRPDGRLPQEDDLTPPPLSDEAIGNEAAVEAALARAEDAAAMAAGKFVEEASPRPREPHKRAPGVRQTGRQDPCPVAAGPGGCVDVYQSLPWRWKDGDAGSVGRGPGRAIRGGRPGGGRQPAHPPWQGIWASRPHVDWPTYYEARPIGRRWCGRLRSTGCASCRV